jgi:glutaredoxin-related protein
LNLGGRLTTAQFDRIQRPVDADRGTFNLNGAIDNAGSTLTFDEAKGTVRLGLARGLIDGGTVVITDGVLQSDQGFLRDVTLDGDIVLDGNDQLRVLGALTLVNDATVQIGGPTNGTSYLWEGSTAPWSIVGDGSIVFGGTAVSAGRNLGNGGAPLTLGPGIVVRATQNGTVDFGNGSVNQGTLLADVAGRTLTVSRDNWINATEGRILASAGTITITGLLRNDGSTIVDGGVLNLNNNGNAYVWTTPGTLRLDRGTLNLGGRLTTAQFDRIQRPVDADRGTFNLNGAIDNAGTTLTFDEAKGTVRLGLSRGLIDGGNVVITDGVLQSDQGFLRDVTLDGDIVLDGSDQLRILGSLTLVNDANVQIGGSTNGTSYLWEGSTAPWSIVGDGSIVFGGTAVSAGRNLGNGSAPLTLGPGIVVRATQNGNVNFGTGGVNQGTLLADVGGPDHDVVGTNWTNPATLSMQNGATMNLSGFPTNAGLIDIGVDSTLSTPNTNLTNTGVIEGSGTLALDTSGLSRHSSIAARSAWAALPLATSRSVAGSRWIPAPSSRSTSRTARGAAWATTVST